MIIKVRRGDETSEITVPDGSRVGDLFGALNLLREEYVPVVNGKVVDESDFLEEGDEVLLLRAFSSG